MSCRRLLPLILLSFAPLPAQNVGQGAPAGVEQRFINAYFRDRFDSYVAFPAATEVRKLGATGFVQEFNPLKGPGRFALVKADASLGIGNGSGEVFQMYPAMYEAYTAAGVANAGYPVMDTGTCPVTTTAPSATVCTFQIFSLHYALFAHPATVISSGSSLNFTIKDPFFTRWAALGGATALGPPASAEIAVTSKSGITATAQQYGNGALYSITSGANSGKLLSVGGRIYTLYASLNLHDGSLGLPTAEELSAGAGKIRQSFEGGLIELTAGEEPVLRPAVGSVVLSIGAGSLTRMNVGENVGIRATVFATVGGELTDREVTWVTSNGRVVAIQPNGRSATLTAVGGGTALISAVSEGKISAILTIFVAAPCCQIGEGSPTIAIQQSFQDAVARSRLTLRVPAANPVRRAGHGYVQDLQSADGAARYLLCRSDLFPVVFLVTGEILRAYEAAGGPAGPLAYPVSDETSTGRQLFEGGALAGRPVQTVAGAILRRWEALGYETGPTGPPVGPARSYLSFSGAIGSAQSFRDALLVQIQTGSFASVTRLPLVRGPFLARYSLLNGPDGSLGFAFTDEYASKDGMVQDFEGGQLRLSADGTDAEVLERERKPEITVNPSRVTAGSRVRITAGGFPAGATIRISFSSASGLAPFEVQSAQGSYTWESPIPVTSRTGAVTVTARNGDAQVSASYTVTAITEANIQVAKIRGDTQSGLPGARLITPLVVSVRDGQGTPLAGIPVKFTSSPGARIIESAIVTGDDGEAQAVIRAQSAEGVLLVTAEATGKTVTFSARVNAPVLSSFPKQTRLGPTFSARESLLAAASSIVRFHQLRNEMPSSLGASDPSVLNEFLKNFCVFDAAGGHICDGFLSFHASVEQLPNLYRLRHFAGNNLDVEAIAASEEAILDTLAIGSPTLLALSVSDASGLMGTHFVVAFGVSSDGDIVIHDPEPGWNRQRLSAYTGGFAAPGGPVKGTLLSALRLAPRSPSPTGFLMTSYRGAITIQSQSGACGSALSWPLGDGRGGRPTGEAQISYCAGLDPVYAVRFAASSPVPALFTDLGSPGRREERNGSGGESFSLTRPASLWQSGPIEVILPPEGIVNAATQTPDFAPGTLLAVSGAGLGAADDLPTVEIGGLATPVSLVSEFRLHVEVPLEILPGDHILRVRSSSGTAELPIKIREVAPAIFRDAKSARAVIVNAVGGTANTPYNPVSRGGVISIYATGLGAIRAQGDLSVTVVPVSVVLSGVEHAAAFAGKAGFPGGYLINFTVPAGAPPGLGLPLFLRQGGVDSEAVQISVR
ncbi:MAG TPA: hypothetical protein VM120_05280 [Bryobacteraceae bacterium]|nr:hypothetical protein [Bryobacteraceae bacterium]